MRIAEGRYIVEVIFLMILCVFIDNISSRSDSMLDSIISISYKLVIIILLFRLYKKVKSMRNSEEE